MYMGHYIQSSSRVCQGKYFIDSSLFQSFGQPMREIKGLPTRKPGKSLPTVEVRLAWTESDAGCGDGGYNAIDPTNSNNVYVACVSSEGVVKSTSGGTPGTWQSATNGINSSDRSSFVPPMVIDPSSPQTLYYGTYRVYQT